MKKKVYLILILLVAVFHLIHVGNWLNAEWKPFYYSYFSDVTIPFAYYCLLGIAEEKMKWLNNWKLKASLIFTGCLFAETLQYFHVNFLGTVFDWYDILAYSSGIFAAVLFEKLIFR